jgi:uncharacterized membrane protein YtjA (UPF0391 family)
VAPNPRRTGTLWDLLQNCLIPDERSADAKSVDGLEPDEPPSPPIGWAITSKVPPGMSDPDDHPGFVLRVWGFAILVVAVLLSFFGNWVVTQSNESLSGTSQGDAVLGIAALLFVVSVALQIVGLVVSKRAQRTPPANHLP